MIEKEILNLKDSLGLSKEQTDTLRVAIKNIVAAVLMDSSIREEFIPTLDTVP